MFFTNYDSLQCSCSLFVKFLPMFMSIKKNKNIYFFYHLLGLPGIPGLSGLPGKKGWLFIKILQNQFVFMGSDTVNCIFFTDYA